MIHSGNSGYQIPDLVTFRSFFGHFRSVLHFFNILLFLIGRWTPGPGSPWDVVPGEIKEICFSDTFGVQKPSPRHFQDHIAIEDRPHGGVIQCPIVPPFSSINDRVRRGRLEDVSVPSRPTQIPKRIPGWPREPECFTLKRRKSIARNRYLTMHPKMMAMLKEKAENPTKNQPTIAPPSGDFLMDTPVPGFYSNQELILLNLPGPIFSKRRIFSLDFSGMIEPFHLRFFLSSQA